MAGNKVILYAYWASSCSWRVRAALHFKRVSFQEHPIDIVRSQKQLTDEYKKINPAQKVPALYIDEQTIVESMAILQYLDDTRPDPPLMPSSAILRARTMEICETIVSGIQPLQNVGLKPHFETEAQFTKFAKYWSERGIQTLESLLKNTAGKYCVGDQLTSADICLVPQLFNAVSRYNLELCKYPTISKLYEVLLNEEIIKETSPQKKNLQKIQ